jgi:zinc and cadmium transporter
VEKSKMKILLWIILMTFLDGLLGLAGIFSYFISKDSLSKIIIFLVSFATGSLIGGALFHFIPETFGKMPVINIILMTSAGAALFFLIEKLLHWHHCHNGQCEHTYTYLILYGDAVHNFIDGLIIAGSFVISIHLGIITSLLVMAHELPQEVGDFGVLVHGGFTRGKAVFYNFLAQLTAILGGILGFFFLSLKENAVYVLPFAAGGFLYIAIGDLIPEIFKEKNKVKITINLLVIMLGMLTLLSAKLFSE